MYGWRSEFGLGDTAPTNANVQAAPPANPTVSNCSYDCTTFWNYMFHPCCVDASPNWAGNLIAGGNPYQGLPPTPAPTPPPAPVATPGNPTPLTTPPANQQMAQDTVDATIVAGQQAQQAQAQDFFSSLDTSLNPAGCSSTMLSGICDSTVLIAGGIVFTTLMLLMFSGGRR